MIGKDDAVTNRAAIGLMASAPGAAWGQYVVVIVVLGGGHEGTVALSPRP